MTIASGTRLGPYEIVALIGAGGMGEVYKARDTRLDRAVAVKILPAEFAQNAQHKTRFEREAKTISQLNHPNICTLHDVGHENGTDYLVMELLEGESLADRIAKGPLPLSEVLKYGVQIAEALGKAHRESVIHRDMKPGNIMLTKSGAKLLDFGLAKSGFVPLAPDGGTIQKPLTQQGTILGTFQYMAPEQLAGEEPDARTDIFALGAVLYEMTTGKRAFEGKSKTSLIGAIVSGQPKPISELQPLTSPALEHVIKKCLAKEPDDRWQSATDIAEELRWIGEVGSQAGVSTPLTMRRKTRELIAWALAAMFAVSTVVFAIGYLQRAPRPVAPIHFVITPPPGTSLIPFDELGLSLSPDGSRLAFVAIGQDGKKKIWLRSFDSLDAQAIPETDGAWYPFWSPDGRYLGFFADGKLKKVDLLGSSPQTLCDAPSGRGGTWSRDGVILFAPNIESPIYKVAASGGAPSPVTRYDPKTEVTHRWPQFLPDGRHFFYVVRAKEKGKERGRLFVASLDSPEGKLVSEDASNATFIPPNQLLFGRSGDLLTQPFDLEQFRTIGEPIPLVKEKLSWWEAKNFFVFTAAPNGALVYLPAVAQRVQMRWVDRTGRPVADIDEPGFIHDARLSPDGGKIAYVRSETAGRSDIWIRDLGRDQSSRFTFASGIYNAPRWSPDASRIAFECQPKNVLDLCIKGFNGDVDLLLESSNFKTLGSWSPDGSAIAYTVQDPQTSLDLWLLPQTGSRQPKVFLRTAYEERDPEFSPNGRWVAYVSNESGKPEVYVRGVASTSAQWQISTAGGAQPRWRRDGKEIFFTSPDGKLMAASVDATMTFQPANPRPLFELPALPRRGAPIFEDVSPDGQKFLLTVPTEQRSLVGFHIVLHALTAAKR